MLLQDEYFQRHNLNIKPIYYTRKANLALRLRARPQVVVEFSWGGKIRAPGFFVFNFLSPNHNGYLDGNYFLASDPYYYQYDEYAAFLARWSRSLNFQPVKSSHIELAVYEMFMYCFDGWLAQHDLEDMAFRGVDPSLTEDQRSDEINKFLDHLVSYDTLVYDIYHSEFMKYANNYADWLAELIEAKKEA